MALTKVTGQVINNTTGLVVGVTTVGGGLSATDGFFSGIVTAVGDASFSGNVSVGGTLTYEDVTNIDAVGLITARNGVVVGSGITLSKDGDVFFTGIATGNGSGLTDLNASNLASGTVPSARLGSGTASSSTFLAGDSTFKTVTGTTINNNADNRVITGSDTANTLNGESNVVIDSNGNMGIGVAAHDPLTALHVQGANDGALKDVFTITNQNGSSGTEVGMVLECGADETARISAKNEGSDIGPLIFSTASSQGANPTEKLRIGSAGQLGIGGANYGTSGQVLKSNGSGAAVSWGAGSDLIAESSAYDMGSVFTNGVNADVIDSSTRRISIGILSYSLSGSDELRIQLRTSAGNITSGYVSRGGYVSNASYAQDQTSSGGFDTYGMGSSSYTWSGWLNLKNYKDNYWYMNADLWADGASTHYWIHGHVNLGAQIVGIRFTRTGSNSFDNGEFKIFQYNTP